MKHQNLSITTFPIDGPLGGLTLNYILNLREDGTGYISFENKEDGNKFEELPSEIINALMPPRGEYTGPSLVGNVYSGTVTTVIPGLSAYLIDISESDNDEEVTWESLKRDGFLSFEDIDPKRKDKLEKGQQIKVRVIRNPKSPHSGVRLTEVF